MDLETFRAIRDQELNDLASLYRPAVAAAIEDNSVALMQEALLAGFQLVYSEIATDDTPAPALAEEFVADMNQGLVAFTPDTDNPDAQADRISGWFATATLGAATMVAEGGNFADKTWITMRDDAVRDLHVPLHGVTVDINDTFLVGGFPLHYPGQPIGPPEVWINCRCVLTTNSLEGLIPSLVASGDGMTGVIIAALPEGDDTVEYNDGDTAPIHQTLAYLGSTDQLGDGEADAVVELARRLAAQTDPFEATVAGTGTLGSDSDDILITEAVELQRLHNQILDDPTALRMYEERNAHPTWISHITGMEAEPGDTITFDRIAAWVGEDRQEFPMTTTEVDDDMVDEDPPVPDELIEPVDGAMEFHGVLIVEGVETGDGRSFSEGGVTWRDLPLPLAWQRVNKEGHSDSVVVGRIDTLERRGNEIWYGGEFVDVPEVEEVVMLIGTQALRGVSADVDMAEMDIPDDDDDLVQALFGNPKVNFASGRIAGGTLVAIPAFQEAYIALGPLSDADAMVASAERFVTDRPWDGSSGRFTLEQWCRSTVLDLEDGCTSKGQHKLPIHEPDGTLNRNAVHNAAARFNQTEAPAEAKARAARRLRGAYRQLGEQPPDVIANSLDDAIDAFRRGPGWVTHPRETSRLHRYWVRGEGAAKIRWGTSGDFTRCTRQLRKYIKPPFLNRTCAEWHHDALGYWPGERGRPGNPPLSNCEECDDMDTIETAPAVNLVAAAPRPVIEASWMTDPALDQITPLTVLPDGRVFGHLAQWGTCHIGIDKTCIEPPHSITDYAHFHLGSVDTTEGEVACGKITLNTGHADTRLSAAATRAHYDDTGTIVAMVRAGEDDFGIWIAGAICDDVDDDVVRTLRASGGISGDWRTIGGNLELVAALAVNVPGFPVPRIALATEGDRQTALVAAGHVAETSDIDGITDAVIAKMEEREARATRLASIQKAQKRERVLALRS